MSTGDVIQFDSATKEVCLKRYTEFFYYLYKHWSGTLGPRNSMVLSFVNMRTYKYGKAAEHISIRHFVDGVQSSSGEVLLTGVGMKETAIRKSLRELEDLGLLRVKAAYNEFGQIANKIEINFKLLREGPDSMSKLNLPKKVKGHHNTRGVGSRKEGGPLRNTNPIKEADIKKQIKRDRNNPPQAGGLEDAVRQAQHKNRAKRQAKRKTLNHRVTKAATKALWAELLISHYPDMPILFMTDKEWGMFKKQHDTINLHGHKLEDILTWIVTEWRDLLEGELSWIWKYEKSIEVPTARVVARFFRKFVEQYSTTQQRSKQATLEDRMERRSQKNDDTEKALRRELEEARQERDKARRQRDMARRTQRQSSSSALPIDDDLPEWRDEE